MRGSRVRTDREDCFYHLMNRTACGLGRTPLGVLERMELFGLVQRRSLLYSLEVLSVVVTHNSYHVVCFAPADLPDRDEVIANWEACPGPKPARPEWDDPATIARFARNMRDITEFTKGIQQSFTHWFNRTRPRGRKGPLWADRFRSETLDGGAALWDCLATVETIPVRAGLSDSPGDYRFSTWGQMGLGNGHPFAANLLRHLRLQEGERAADRTDEQILAELGRAIARVAAERPQTTTRTGVAEGWKLPPQATSPLSARSARSRRPSR